MSDDQDGDTAPEKSGACAAMAKEMAGEVLMGNGEMPVAVLLQEISVLSRFTYQLQNFSTRPSVKGEYGPGS